MRLLLLVVIAVSAVSTSAQMAPSSATGVRTRIVIDGSKEPDRITDGTAMLMLYKVVADDSSNGLTMRARMSFLRPSGLTDSEMGFVMESATNTLRRIREMESEASKRFAATGTQVDDLLTGREQIVRAATDSLLSRIGHARAELFRAFVRDQIKKRIRVSE